MCVSDFFLAKPRKISILAKKLGISSQAIHYVLKKAKDGESQRLTALILYRLGLNCNDEVLDFLLDDTNFDENQRIKNKGAI